VGEGGINKSKEWGYGHGGQSGRDKVSKRKRSWRETWGYVGVATGGFGALEKTLSVEAGIVSRF
jgi:hypothetical protein